MLDYMEDLRDRIEVAWRVHEDPDVSTGKLLQRVADDCQCDVADVVAVLTANGTFRESE